LQLILFVVFRWCITVQLEGHIQTVHSERNEKSSLSRLPYFVFVILTFIWLYLIVEVTSFVTLKVDKIYNM
jgi:hypothetical protein